MYLNMFFSMINKSETYELLTDDEKLQINIFDLLTSDKNLILLLQNILNFFIKEDVEFSIEHSVFLVKSNTLVNQGNKMVDKYETIGAITRDNYKDVVDVILERNNIKKKDTDDPSKAKNKKALEIMKKIKKGREELSKATKEDKNMELGNIISAVANKSHTLNIMNIWDLTVFQLWDCFIRLNNNNMYNINAMSVSTWGDKDNKFDFNGWFKQLNN